MNLLFIAFALAAIGLLAVALLLIAAWLFWVASGHAPRRAQPDAESLHIARCWDRGSYRTTNES